MPESERNWQEDEDPGILPVVEWLTVEETVGLNMPVPTEDQLFGRGFHAQLLPQLPQGGGHKIHPRRDVPGAGNIVAAGPGVLLRTPFLQQHLGLPTPKAQQPHMTGSVGNPP